MRPAPRRPQATGRWCPRQCRQGNKTQFSIGSNPPARSGIRENDYDGGVVSQSHGSQGTGIGTVALEALAGWAICYYYITIATGRHSKSSAPGAPALRGEIVRSSSVRPSRRHAVRSGEAVTRTAYASTSLSLALHIHIPMARCLPE
jgi:hypothetical protein